MFLSVLRIVFFSIFALAPRKKETTPSVFASTDLGRFLCQKLPQKLAMFQEWLKLLSGCFIQEIKPFVAKAFV
jgi:hypothetical protein